MRRQTTKTIIMGKYLERYHKELERFEAFKKQCLNEVVNLFQTIQLKPITIGNGTYYICVHNKKVVPAYLDSVSGEFRPIYDKDATYDFGWADFDQVVRLLDMIREKILSTRK